MANFLDLDGVKALKRGLVSLFDLKLSTKQEKGDYVTKKDLADFNIGLEASNYGNPRNRDTSDPTYGLESILIADKLTPIDTGDRRVRDPSKPSFGL